MGLGDQRSFGKYPHCGREYGETSMTVTNAARKPITGTVVKPRVFSGIQPSGQLHLGNYLGAIRRWVENQEKWDNIYCIVDLHAITRPQDPAALQAARMELATVFLAAGLDPTKCALIMQSDIQYHAELAWLFNCITPLGWLERMTQYKEKAGAERERESL